VGVYSFFSQYDLTCLQLVRKKEKGESEKLGLLFLSPEYE